MDSGGSIGQNYIGHHSNSDMTNISWDNGASHRLLLESANKIVIDRVERNRGQSTWSATVFSSIGHMNRGLISKRDVPRSVVGHPIIICLGVKRLRAHI
jgi:hypothetical protein